MTAFEGAAAFTTKPKHERSTSKRPAFKSVSHTADEATAEVQQQQTTTGGGSNTAAFVHPVAVAYGSHARTEEDDEEVIGYGTAVVSCVLSLVLGFGLGYGT